MRKLKESEHKKRGQMEPFERDDLQLIRSVLQRKGRHRDLALLNVAIDTMLRSNDVLQLKVSDVRDHLGGIVESFSVTQEKTREAVRVNLTPQTRKCLADFLKVADKWADDYLFTRDSNPHGVPLTSMSLRRLVKEWAALCHKDPNKYSGHSLRRTKASFIYRETGNIEAIRRLLGHTSIAHTQVYLGVSDKEVSDLAMRYAI
jgi:integrase